VGIFLNGILSM